MAARTRGGALTKAEKRIVKALLNKGERNQDIQAILNIGRAANRLGLPSARPDVPLGFYWGCDL
jgi:hypothetical protein